MFLSVSSTKLNPWERKLSHHIPLNIHDIPWVLVKCSIYQEVSSNPQPPTFPTFDPHLPKIPQPPRTPAIAQMEHRVFDLLQCVRAARQQNAVLFVTLPELRQLLGHEVRSGKNGEFFGLNIGETNKKSTKIVCQASIN